MNGYIAPSLLRMFSEDALGAKALHLSKLDEIERSRVSQSLPIPTSDSEIRRVLRLLEHPVCFFAEDQADRRERLKGILANLAVSKGVEFVHDKLAQSGSVLAEETPSSSRRILKVTEGSAELLEFRRKLIKDSLKRAEERTGRQRITQEEVLMGDNRVLEGRVSRYMLLMDQMKTVENQFSEIGDSRPLGACSFSADGEIVATGGWSGKCSLWQVQNAKKILNWSIEDHSRISDMSFGPNDTLVTASSSVSSPLLLYKTSLVDFDSCSISSPTEFRGHSNRVARVKFLPYTPHFISSSMDCTWRLWDVETQQCLLTQDGHADGVYGIGVHPDGSLVCSSDVSGICRLWDLRTGKKLHDFVVHSQEVLSIDFSFNGFHMCTGSGDNSAKLINLRKKIVEYTFTGHLNLVSDVKFQKDRPHESLAFGEDWLMTCSYDKTAKIWSLRDFTLLHSLVGHEDKVMRGDVCSKGNCFATVGYDRTLKLWTPRSSRSDF